MTHDLFVVFWSVCAFIPIPIKLLLTNEKNALQNCFTLPPCWIVSVFYFKFANGISDKNKACNQTPGHISITIELHIAKWTLNERFPTTTTISNEWATIFPSYSRCKERSRWRITGMVQWYSGNNGGVETAVTASCMWRFDLVCYQLKQCSMPKSAHFFFLHSLFFFFVAKSI